MLQGLDSRSVDYSQFGYNPDLLPAPRLVLSNTIWTLWRKIFSIHCVSPTVLRNFIFSRSIVQVHVNANAVLSEKSFCLFRAVRCFGREIYAKLR